MTRRLADLPIEQRDRQRAAQRANNRRWRTDHPDYEREWREKNLDRRRAGQRAWRAANPEKARTYAARRRSDPEQKSAYMARYRREHRADLAAYMAAYRPAYNAEHREGIAAKKSAAYFADPERVIRNVGRWKEEHPTRARAIRMSAAANRRAEACGADGRLSADDIVELWRRQPDCLGCGEGSGLDHIVPFCRGGMNTTGNLQNLCRSCNSRKGRQLPDEWARRNAA